MDHAFLVNVHKDAAQAVRLCRVLREHFRTGADVLVHMDGQDYAEDELRDLSGLVTKAYYPGHEPDKCLGVTAALSNLVQRAAEAGVSTCSLLHPDMVPTDRWTWYTFLHRFRRSGKALTWTPMHPGHHGISYINLHFRLPEALRLFPIQCQRVEALEDGGWFNEMQTRLHFDKAWPEWQQHAYPMALHTVPWTGHHLMSVSKVPCFKVAHAPGVEYGYHDYSPESSVIHTDDVEGFWNRYREIVRC